MRYGSDQIDFMIEANQTVDHWNNEQIMRYVGHLEEEARETRDAFFSDDMVKTLDGLVDTIVVALGAIISMGIDPDLAWSAVHRKNMSKVDGSLGPTIFRPDGQVGKPPGWTGPEDVLQQLIDDALSR